ncbi:ZBED1-like protein [Mya arenaria]|uniref:ZBED1-like protein n=1 Tax=Mya arenaria TaxID=6604 RepID=A0ABY7EBK3_MYAAR|nr:ZBED1-like protein [Mya arenaria]
MLDVSHTGVNVGEALAGVICEFDLMRSSDIAVVSDNAANMDVAAKASMLSPHIKCFAHTVNLACQKGVTVEGLKALLSKVRRIITFFHKSTTATAALKLHQNTDKQHKLVKDVSTRWNSTYEMLARYVEQHETVTKILSSSDFRNNVKGIIPLSPDDVSDLELVIKVLAPLKQITTIMFDTKVPTIPLILVFKMRIINALRAEDNDSEVVCSVKNAIWVNMEKRYTNLETQEFLYVATALDPRFKCLLDLPEVKREELYSKLAERAEVIDIQTESTVHDVTVATPTSPRAGSSSGSLPSLPRQPNLDENQNKLTEVLCEPVKKKAESVMEELLGDVYITNTDPAVSASEQARVEVEKYRSKKGGSIKICSTAFLFELQDIKQKVQASSAEQK